VELAVSGAFGALVLPWKDVEFCTYECSVCSHRGEYACRLTGMLGECCGQPMRLVSTRMGTLTMNDQGKLCAEEDR
jgi:hypothetical protein